MLSAAEADSIASLRNDEIWEVPVVIPAGNLRWLALPSTFYPTATAMQEQVQGQGQGQTQIPCGNDN
jgi:hypothetical protein